MIGPPKADDRVTAALIAADDEIRALRASVASLASERDALRIELAVSRAAGDLGRRVSAEIERGFAGMRREQPERPDPAVDRALDALESILRKSEGNPYHKGKGPGGGQFASGPGGGGGEGSESERERREEHEERKKRRKKAVRQRRKVAKGYKSKAPAKGAPKDSARVEAAKKSHKRTAKAEKDYAKANEHKFANHIGGKSYPDNEPSDVDVNVDGKGHHLELKSMLTSEQGKANMGRESIGRKIAKSRETGRPFHMVILDDRDVYNGGGNAHLHSGNRMYFKSGIARYNVKDMHPVKDEAEIKALLATPYKDWPAKARASKNAVAGMNAKWIGKPKG